MRHKKIFSILLPVLLLALYALFLAHPINLATADLGRHLQNGAELLQNGNLIRTNFYSYTYPDFPATNHHWGAGALFYLVFRAFGFAGVQAFFIAIALAAFFVFFQIAKKRGGLAAAGLLSLLVIPLLGERAEVRPEIFSYLFAGIFFWCLLERKWLWSLPIIMVLWVNSHIYFFLGPAIIGAFWLAHPNKKLALIFALTTAATLANPFFLHGAIAPFTVFQNYGYNLAENQPLWKITYLLPGNPNYVIFEFVLALLIVGFIWKLWRDRQNFSWANLFLAAGVTGMGLLQLRNFSLFGLFALPIIAENLNKNKSAIPAKESRLPAAGRESIQRGLDSRLRGNDKTWWAVALTSLALLLALTGELKSVFPQLQNYRLGLAPGITRAAEFWKNNNLQGPIFNNYDIGGYLIYSGEEVFVDNRPEAYPASFFRDEYIPMQESEEAWQKRLAKYNFQAIFFWWRDYTPWAQTFLKKRLEDPEWRQVYLDDYAIIFVRNENSLTLSPGDGESRREVETSAMTQTSPLIPPHALGRGK